MELILLRSQQNHEISVQLDDAVTHTFDLTSLIPDDQLPEAPPSPLEDPQGYGQALFTALFPAGSLTASRLADSPERLLLVTGDEVLQSIPWEFLYSPNGFLVCDLHFVRGLPVERRLPAPDLSSSPLHITAVPSHPLHPDVPPLNIEGEWLRLTEVLERLEHDITMERVRPPSLEQLGQQLSNKAQRVLHFMGHGGQTEEGATLLFENTFGNVDPVSAIDFTRSIRRATFLVTLNACVTATPGETEFANLAAALVARKIPYALGMRFSVPDEDARTFSRVFYGVLGQGAPVEEAVRQARFQLSRGERPWMVGLPVLYTALDAPATGFASQPGKFSVLDPQLPTIEISPLPQTDGAFHGRIPEMLGIGKALTGDDRPRLLTIHGGGGQGKTALAREVAQRFAYAFPGGVWAFSLENLPSKESFVAALARFLNISLDEYPRPEELETQLLRTLPQRRRLLILDNAETLVEAVDKEDPAAIELNQFLRHQVSQPPLTILATSRRDLNWPGEKLIELDGLEPDDGAALFHEVSGRRQVTFAMYQAKALSRTLDGHPLGLRLLASAYREGSISFEQFTIEYETHLLTAEDKLLQVSHRHRSLSASITMSVQYLSDDLRNFLSSLWIFHSPFLPETAAAIYDPDAKENRGNIPSPVLAKLMILHQRSLLALELLPTHQGLFLLYRLLPTLRPFVRELPQVFEKKQLQQRFGLAMAKLASRVGHKFNEGGFAVILAQQCTEDFSRALAWVDEETKAWFANNWGWILQRLGDRQRSLTLLEYALEFSEGRDPQLALTIINNLGSVYRDIGQPKIALDFLNQALLSSRQMKDRTLEATTLANLGEVHRNISQPKKALDYFNQALPIFRQVGDHARAATTLNNMGLVIHTTGHPKKALKYFNKSLPIFRKLNDRGSEGATLSNIGLVYRSISQPQKALDYYTQSLPILREVGDRVGEAATLSNMGSVYSNIGQPQKALNFFNQALPLRREVGDLIGEANTLSNMGLLHLDIDHPEQALNYFNQALTLHRQIGDQTGEANTLSNLGLLHLGISQPKKAFEYYSQALPILRKVGHRDGEAAALSSLGTVSHALGRPKEALRYLKQALPITRQVGNLTGETTALNNLGNVYRDIGQPQLALDSFKQALPILKEIDDRTGEADTLNNIGEVYSDLGEYNQALNYFHRALILQRQVRSRSGEATALNNIGKVYLAISQLDRALRYYEQALLILQEDGDRAGEATTLNSIGLIYYQQGNPEATVLILDKALKINRETKQVA